MVNSADVSAAPIQTSRHATFASGSTLKINAKRPVTTKKENAKFINCSTASGRGSNPPNHFPNADKALLRINETRSKKPVPSTATNERKRSLIKPHTPRPYFGSTPQTVLSASWSCPKTPEAPISSVATATAVAKSPVDG